MKAVIVTQPGGPDVLAVQERPQPVPQGDQILVRVLAAGLNRADLSQRRGAYPAPPDAPADILGLEFVGIAAPSDTAAAAPGDAPPSRIFGITGGGAQAEYLVTYPDLVLPVPAHLSDAEAAAIPEVWMTAFDALQQGGLAAGQRVLVHAVGSGVGTAALQLARAAGATVYGSARSADKLTRARALGLADGWAGDEWAAGVLAATGGAGVDLVLDFVGAAYLGDNLRVLAPRGRIIVVGTLGGAVGELDLRLLMGKRASIIGTVLRSRPRHEKAALTAAFGREVLPLLARGDLLPVVDRVFAMEEIAAAHQVMEANTNFGKLVLMIAATPC